MTKGIAGVFGIWRTRRVERSKAVATGRPRRGHQLCLALLRRLKLHYMYLKSGVCAYFRPDIVCHFGPTFVPARFDMEPRRSRGIALHPARSEIDSLEPRSANIKAQR